MKKTPPIKKNREEDSKPFTSGEAKRMFSAIQEHFDDNFKIINERMNLTDENNERRFSGIEILLREHSQILGRLLIETEEIKLGFREKVSLSEFNKLETRLVLLESIVLGGNTATKNKLRK